jgi:hypothetical protein
MECGDWESKKKYRRLANPICPLALAGKNASNHQNERLKDIRNPEKMIFYIFHEINA